MDVTGKYNQKLVILQNIDLQDVQKSKNSDRLLL
jgi:uncharacterized protein YciI